MMRTNKTDARATANDDAKTKAGGDDGAAEFTVSHVPPDRALVVDGGILASKRHVIHGFVEADVTAALELRQRAGEWQQEEEQEQQQGERRPAKPFSISAYLIACLARAVEANPAVQGYLTGGGRRLVVFRDVDVATMVEFREGTAAIPHVVRKANRKSVREISDELAAVKGSPKVSEQYSGKFARLAPRLPRWVRMVFFRRLRRDPRAIQRNCGTVMLTSVGMFGKGHGGWGLTYMPLHTLGVTVGGIQSKPAVVHGGADGQPTIVPRDFVHLTLSFDHDVVDGAPAARFARQFLDLIEGASLLEGGAGDDDEGRGTNDGTS